MSITDWLTSWLIGTPVPPLLIVSVAVGYSIVISYYYGTTFWDKIGFGERLIFAFLFGAPIAIFDSALDEFVGTSLGRVGVPYDYNAVLYLLMVINIVFIGSWRLHFSKPLGSAGTEPAAKVLQGRRMLLPYAASFFGISTTVFNHLLAGSQSAESLAFLQDQVIALLVLAVLAYPLFVLTPLTLLTSPEHAGEIAVLVEKYSWPVDLPLKLRPSLFSISFRGWVKEPSHLRALSVLLLALLLGAYIPTANASFSIYAPQVVGSSVSYDPTIVYTSSPSNRFNFTLVQVTRTYKILSPMLSYMNISIPNPSNFSVWPGSPPSSITTSWTGYNYIGYSGFGSVTVSYNLNSAKQVTAFEVDPSPGGRTIDTGVTLTYYDLVTDVITTNSAAQSYTLPNGTSLANITLSIRNNSSHYVHVAHLYLTVLKTNSTYSGTCTCSSGISFDRLPDSTELYGEFFVSPHSQAVALITIMTPPQP